MLGVLPEDTPFAGQGFIPTRKVREPPGKYAFGGRKSLRLSYQRPVLGILKAS